ncbi:AAA domain containing protein, putative [Leishmania donovani]|uniref:AAA domain containing protein, putative n=1 Tax=Leishmania donovani TaxID=5661 RepID=A0A3Q8IRW3_LEIDO|nr:AAA domain containing protein, putative [Leishmania donovani]
MGVGLSTVRHAGTAILVPTASAASAAVLPLSSEERVAALPVTTTRPAAADAAAAAPAPPTAEHTSNPRQRLTDTQAAHAAVSLRHAAPKPDRRFPPYPEETSALATPPPAAVLTAAPVVAEAAVKRHRKESGATKPLHPAQASLLTRAEEGQRDATGDAIIAVDRLRRRCCPDAGVGANRNMNCNEDATLLVRSPDEGRRSGTSLQTEGGLYGEKGQRQFAASAKSSPSPASPEAEEVATTACASVKAAAHADAPGGPAAPLLSSTFTAYRPVARSASPGPALGQYEGLPLTSVQQVLESKHKVYRICLTGGPCAGKSTMLSAIQAKIPQRTGFRVMCVPEAATLLVTGGMQWDGDLTVPQQLGLLRTQLALEDQFYALAVASNVPTVIVSDRGTMDGRAFCTDEQFQEILRGVGSTIDVLRDRYDAVIHMVTAADGAEEFYNLDNPARYEDLDGARASDLRLQRMYVGHPMFRLLDNSTTFEDKIERGLQVVSQVVHKEQCAPALPTYYLVRRCPVELPVASATYTTHTTVLSNSQISDIRLLVKREMADGSTMHFFKSVRDAPSTVLSSRAPPRATSHASSGASFRSSVNAPTVSTASPTQQRIESAQRISSREYASLCKHRDSTRAEVVMRATHFIFEGANYELTTMIAPSWAAGRQTLTVESCTVSTAKQEQVHPHGSRQAAPPAAALRLPPFLEVDREVPVESLTTTFLISHKETGPLYTSLAFAPVFSRAVLTALGAHADTENILSSTVSTPRGTPALRTEKGTLHIPPALAETREDSGLPAKAPVLGEGNQRVENAENLVFMAAPPPLPLPARRGLAPLDVNALAISAPAMKSATSKAEGTHHVELASSPLHLDESTSVRKQHNVDTPSSFSLAGEEGGTAKVTTAAPAGERLQPERLMARDPESVLPPIGTKKSTPVACLRS